MTVQHPFEAMLAEEDSDNVAEPDRPTVFVSAPTPAHETELGPILEKLYQRFYETADFVDPASLHEGGGGGGDSLVDIDKSRYWNSDGTFNEKEWGQAHARKKNDSFIIDVIRGDVDDALGFDGFAERFLDIAVEAADELIEINPLLFDVEPSLTPNLIDFVGPVPIVSPPFVDVEFEPIEIDPIGAILEFVKEMIFQSIRTVADVVLVARKEGHNMFGSAMEVKEAKDNNLPVAVYDHSADEDGNPIPVMLDQHADYVTNNINWATAWLVEEAKNRDENDVQRLDGNDEDVPAMSSPKPEQDVEVTE
jgi:hypothetical protein